MWFDRFRFSTTTVLARKPIVYNLLTWKKTKCKYNVKFALSSKRILLDEVEYGFTTMSTGSVNTIKRIIAE